MTDAEIDAVACATGMYFDDYENNTKEHCKIFARAILAAQKDRIVELKARIDRAERALRRSGFQDLGGQEWKPPLGKPPVFIEVPMPTVPEGYKLVPIEPTEEMIDAANECEASWKSIYPAMLAAAPQGEGK